MAAIDIASLSYEERLRFLDELWESLSRTPEAIPLTNAQREELDRRLDELDHEEPIGIPWEEVLRRIRGRTPFGPASAPTIPRPELASGYRVPNAESRSGFACHFFRFIAK